VIIQCLNRHPDIAAMRTALSSLRNSTSRAFLARSRVAPIGLSRCSLVPPQLYQSHRMRLASWARWSPTCDWTRYRPRNTCAGLRSRPSVPKHTSSVRRKRLALSFAQVTECNPINNPSLSRTSSSARQEDRHLILEILYPRYDPSPLA
jgi:hypothetical protein